MTSIPSVRSALRISLLFTAILGSAFAQQAPNSRTASQPSASAPANQFTQMATGIGDDYFDGNDSVERIRRHVKVARALGVRYLRCAFSWNGIEPERGQYHFEFWDKLVAEAERSGITLIPYVAYTPKWAASKEQDFWKQPPTDPALFADIMRTLALRYRGKITHWELWNEPDNKEYWDGTPDRFAETVMAAAKAIREVAPEDALVLGGMSFGTGPFFTTLVEKYRLDHVVDIIAMHAYAESWNEERVEVSLGPWIERMQEVAQRSGNLLWLNEMGYADYRFESNHASVWGTNTYYSYEHTARYSADFLFKSFVMALASGDISFAGWYRIDDFPNDDPRMPQDKVNHHLGIVDIHGRPKPAFFAFRFFNTLFSKPTRTVSATMVKPGSQAVLRVFERKDGKVIVAAWLRSSNYDEVAVHTGMARDGRREQLNVALPCTAAQVSTFDVLGKKISTSRPRQRMLRNIRVTGDRVYVAEVTCVNRAK